MWLRIFPKIFLIVAILTANIALAQAVPDCEDVPGAVTTDGVGLVRPESIQWDAKSGFWYQSNQGDPNDPTDGFISKLNPDGTVAELKWVTGLGHPTGIRIFKDELYVADRDFNNTLNNNAVVVIDLADGSIVKHYSISSTLLNGGAINDPAVDKKTDAIYVSVFSINANLGNTVLKVPLAGNGSDASQLASPASLAFGRQPNGTLLYQNDLIVMNSINSDGTYGGFKRVDLDTGTIEHLGSPTSAVMPGPITPGLNLILDGVERDGGDFLFTINDRGRNPDGTFVTGFDSIFARIRFQPDGTVKDEVLCTLPPGEGAADIGINRDTRVVAIPHLRQFAPAGTSKGAITFVSLDEFP